MTHESARVVSEHRRSIDDLFNSTSAAVLAYATRRTSSVADAEDAVAETYLVAWRRRDTIPASESLAWLYGVCRRVLANQRRGNGRRSRLLERIGLQRQASSTPDLPNPGPALAALGRLRPDDQEILRLVAWEQLTNIDIAVALAITPNAAAIRLHRARRRFAEVYRGLADPEDLKALGPSRTSPLVEGTIPGETQRERST